MTATSRITASALIGVLMMLGGSAVARAQSAAPNPPAITGALTGRIAGEARDERGAALRGVVVTFVGATVTFAVTDDQGRYETGLLPAGTYQVRARAAGYTAPVLRTLRVRPGARTPSSFRLRRETTSPDNVRPAASEPTEAILAAGLGVGDTSEEPAPVPAERHEGAVDEQPQTEVGWRLRHLRRGVLRDTSLPGALLAADAPDRDRGFSELAGRAMSSSARIATNLLADVPLSGHFQLLTTNSFDAPQRGLSGLAIARGIAYVSVGAPVGERADWTVRGAITEADIASWFVSGAYKARPSERRAYDLGLSYSTQQYVGGNLLALRDVSDGTRNVTNVYGFETFTIAPAVTLAYGAEYARYDYLDRRDLLSPRASITVGSAEGTRLSVAVSSRADAPGAGEFVAPGENGLWLPPQRTFSSVTPDAPLRSERTTQVDAEVSRQFKGTTVAIRGFRQQVAGQLVTVFGAESPEFPGSRLGHYLVGTAGDAEAVGGGVSVRSAIGSRVRGSVAYSTTVARLLPTDDVDFIVWRTAGGTARLAERLHDVSTSIEADVPETATRVLVLYRLGNGYGATREDDGTPSGIDARFDLQVRQSLPFLNFHSARWEMLIAVRNFFRDPEADQSIYDELLTVRAPKRLVGGVSLHF
jgi:hypothetical protein